RSWNRQAKIKILSTKRPARGTSRNPKMRSCFRIWLRLTAELGFSWFNSFLLVHQAYATWLTTCYGPDARLFHETWLVDRIICRQEALFRYQIDDTFFHRVYKSGKFPRFPTPFVAQVLQNREVDNFPRFPMGVCDENN